MPAVPTIIAILSLLPAVFSILKDKGSKRVLIRGVSNTAVNMLVWTVAYVANNLCNNPNQQIFCGQSFDVYWLYVFVTIVNIVFIPIIWRDASTHASITSKESITKIMGISVVLFVLFIFAVVIFVAYVVSRS